MTSSTEPIYYLGRSNLQDLLDELARREFELVGPKVDQEAIVYDQIERVEDLPAGWTDEQAPGHYRLKRREDDALFGYVIGPHSWKKYLFPPLVNVMSSQREPGGWTMREEPIEPKRFALIGVRACELAAIAVQDRVFMSDSYVDPIYAKRREGLFIVAVNCTQAAATCFCASMETGPRCRSTFDLALTELPSGFVMEVGSPVGQDVVGSLDCRQATEAELQIAEAQRQIAVTQITRKLETEGIRDKLLSRLEHPRWANVADRCLSCANCTLVCPTCFCSSVEDVTDLTNDEVIRQRQWDSCFNFDFSHISGGPIRDQTRSRYRQWLTHKLASWIDQFGTSGCVGCGRCITWCPVGIDLTQEVAAICSDAEQS